MERQLQTKTSSSWTTNLRHPIRRAPCHFQKTLQLQCERPVIITRRLYPTSKSSKTGHRPPTCNKEGTLFSNDLEWAINVHVALPASLGTPHAPSRKVELVNAQLRRVLAKTLLSITLTLSTAYSEDLEHHIVGSTRPATYNKRVSVLRGIHCNVSKRLSSCPP